ncbi:NADH dehydrogenase [ubiquinone] 1 alpha subcomplex assembly factor 4-like isoform X3 [Centroberyx affinis]|uniref:NADH dehydrogenase [ubiquinone] 1 alpha subcomplex assembly factor 4-like isoform X3 n=1 Tax=Centroberyx affinis TaxID=166261 RepID=UPI003A5B9819
MSNMGARVARMFRNFNLENRALREISKEKPTVAPRHTGSTPASVRSSEPEVADSTDSIHQRNDPLLTLLKSVYVESKDPAASEPVEKEEERRPLKFSLPGDPYGLVEITDVPKGKLSLVEALKALNSHKREPQTWTPEKISQEYSLDLKDTKALVDFFVPFDVKIIPPKTGGTKQIKAS